jgi:hypothetical protein
VDNLDDGSTVHRVVTAMVVGRKQAKAVWANFNLWQIMLKYEKKVCRKLSSESGVAWSSESGVVWTRSE